MREILRILQKNNRKGFTLAELLIVIAITGILASFGFVEVAKAQRKLKRTEMDNTAREIFVAAQNHLTSSQTNGIWNASYVKNDGSINIQTSDWQNAVGYAFTDYSDDTSVYSTAQTDTKTHAFYYVIYNKTTYAEALTNSNSVLQQLLPYGSIDDTIRTEGSYVIEFDAKTESVYGVFYTDKGVITNADLSSLNDSRKDSTAREQFSITDTTNASKKVPTAMGYYGGAKAFKNEVNLLTPAKVTIFNDGNINDASTGNTIVPSTSAYPSYANVDKKSLVAVITDPNYKITKPTSLMVTVSQITNKNGSTQSTPCVSFKINAPGSMTNDAGSLTITKSSSILTSSGSDTETAEALANLKATIYSRPAASGTGIDYYITLDDISGTKRHFCNLFSGITPGVDVGVWASASDGTQSTGAAGATTNTLFDYIVDASQVDSTKTAGTGNYCAQVRTARQLQNLSQDVSKYASSSTYAFNLTAANLTSDIDWKEYTDKLGESDVTLADGTTTTLKNFQTIYNTTLSYFTGNNTTTNRILSTFDVRAKDGFSGLFSKIDQSTISISNIDLEDFNVSGTNHMGALIGKVGKATTITNVHVYNSSDNGSSNTYGKADTGYYGVKSEGANAGGLIGESSSTLTISNSSASVKVNADSGIAGGLIGNITGGTVTIDSSYVGGKVKSKTEYDTNNDAMNIYGDTAGGVIGSFSSNSSATINNVYSTASVYGATNAGGFAGKIATTLNASNIYIAAPVNGGSTNGIFVGSLTKNKLTSSNGSLRYLNSVANAIVTSTYGSGKTNGAADYVRSASFNDLKTSSNDVTAVSYTSLGTVYPYASSLKTHYGDWVTEARSNVTLVKNIYFDQTVDNETERKFIVNNTQFTAYVWYYSGWYKYNTYSLKDSSCTANSSNDGYACELKIMDLEPGYSYIIKENTDDSNLQSRYQQLNYYNYFSTWWSYSYTGTIVSAPYSVSAGPIYGDTTSACAILNSTQKTTFTFSNHYKLKQGQSGLLYYEKYADGTYKLHGYSSDGYEIGDGNYSTSASTDVVEDGYVLAVNDGYYLNGKSGEEKINANLAYCNSANSSYWNDYAGSKIASLVKSDNSGQLIKATSDEIAGMGLSGSHVYKLNLDSNYINNIYQDGKSFITVTDSNSSNTNIIGKYTFNPFFADTVKAVDKNYRFIQGGDAYHRLRTNAQLDRLLMANGHKVIDNGFTSGASINQELDIDMSAYYTAHLKANDTYYLAQMDGGMTYQGGLVTLDDGTTRYAKLSGVKNTFIVDLNGGTFRNLVVSLDVGKLTDIQAQQIQNNDNYGMFLSKMTSGNLSNIEFVDSNIADLTINKSTEVVGIIGYVNNGSVSNVSFDNINISNANVTAYSFGLIGEQHVDLSSFAADGVTWESSKINVTNCGIIGYSHNGIDLDDAKFLNVTWDTLTLGNGNYGLIGTMPTGTSELNEIQIKTVNWKTITGTPTYLGLIASSSGSNVIDAAKKSAMSIEDVTFSDMTVTTDHLGLFGKYEGSSNGLTISDVTWEKLNITPASTSWKTYSANPTSSNSNVALIPLVASSQTFTETSITNVTIHNLNDKATFTGIFGDVNGYLNNTKLSDIHLYNDANLKYQINGQYYGLIGRVGKTNGSYSNDGIIKNLQITKGDQYGFTMENLTLNTKYWGVIGLNNGLIYNDKFNDVVINNIDSTAASSTLELSNSYVAYGFVGENYNEIYSNVFNNLSVSKIYLPTKKMAM